MLFLGGGRQDFGESIDKFEIPCVLVTTGADGWDMKNLSSVAIDDEAAAECAVDYLIENGHRNIAEIGGNLELSETSISRHKGYVNSLERHGIKWDERYYEKARFSFDSAYAAMTRLLEKDIPITAVFAISDVMAIGAIRAIRDKGLSVPEDISITGFDGTTLADYYNPKIVSIRQQHRELATRSVELTILIIYLIASRNEVIQDIRGIFRYKGHEFVTFIKKALPLASNEFLWGIGSKIQVGFNQT